MSGRRGIASLFLALMKDISPIKKHLCIINLERYGLLRGLASPFPEQAGTVNEAKRDGSSEPTLNDLPR